MRLVQERTMFKILIERTGALFSITTKQRAYFFFISTQLTGARIAPTTDPYPGIVEICDYEIPKIVKLWDTLANVKLKGITKQQVVSLKTLEFRPVREDQSITSNPSELSNGRTENETHPKDVTTIPS